MSVSSEIITVSGLNKRFQIGDNSVVAVNNINLAIDAGYLTALMGPSGSGKSTLLNLLGALDSADSGTIAINGTDLTKLSSEDRANFRNEICGFIFQNFNLIPVLTALENVMLPINFSRTPKSVDFEARARELLRRVNLEKQIDQPVNRLSGGQMQRVAIARALINSPKVILADEPTANLDESTATSIIELLKDIARTTNTVVLIATHDPNVTKRCDRVIKLRDGQVSEDFRN